MNQFIQAWKFFASNWNFFIILAAPVMMLEIATASMLAPIQNATQPEDIVNYFAENLISLLSIALLGLVLSNAFMGAIFIAYASIDSDSKVEPLNTLFLGVKKFFPLFSSSLITLVAVTFGFLLLVIPGFYVLARLSLFPAFIMLENKGTLESLQLSWEKTEEHGWTLFGLTITFFSLSLILSLVTQSILSPGLTLLVVLAIIEYVIKIPWGYVYFSLYKSLKRH